MSVKSTSIKIVGIIWFLVGAGLSIAGILWILKLGLGPKLALIVAVSLSVGLLKGKFILQKVALKYHKRADEISFTKKDIFTGWAKILGVKGFLLIGIMIAMGRFLRSTPIDRPILGLIYLAVGIALVYASKIFFKQSKTNLPLP